MYDWWRWSCEWERQRRTFLSLCSVSQLWGFKEAWMKFPSWQTHCFSVTECHLFLILNLFSTDILFISETYSTNSVPPCSLYGPQTSSSVLVTSHTMSLTQNGYKTHAKSQKQRIPIALRGKPSVGENGGWGKMRCLWKKWITLHSCLWPTLSVFFSFSNDTMWYARPR